MTKHLFDQQDNGILDYLRNQIDTLNKHMAKQCDDMAMMNGEMRRQAKELVRFKRGARALHAAVGTTVSLDELKRAVETYIQDTGVKLLWRTVMADIHAALDFLRSLGDTRDDVAAWLRQHECKGVMGTSTRCPLACALHGKFGGTWHVNNLDFANEIHVPAPLPEACRDFTAHFDSNLYPDLVVSSCPVGSVTDA